MEMEMDQQFDGSSEGKWSNTLSGMYAVQETDFMAEISGNFCVTNDSAGFLAFGVPSAFWPSNELTVPNATAGIDQYPYYSTDIASTHNFFSFSQGSSSTSTGSKEDSAWKDKNMVLLNGNCSIPVDFSVGDAKASSYLVDVENSESDKEKPILLSEIFQQVTAGCTGSPKRPRPSIEEIPKNKRNVKSRKSPKSSAGNSKRGNEDPQGQSSNSFCSEDESNASQEWNVGDTSAVNLNGKTRASRGSATDPQSLYARKRRERINERLRILQNLVPNGTKVDISTMLEEAVQYVKFLQFQIQLLSSDDLWMYAPIAYNGMNIGLDLKMITKPKQPYEANVR